MLIVNHNLLSIHDVDTLREFFEDAHLHLATREVINCQLSLVSCQLLNAVRNVRHIGHIVGRGQRKLELNDFPLPKHEFWPCKLKSLHSS